MKIEKIAVDYINANRSACYNDKSREIKSFPWLSIIMCESGYYTISINGSDSFDVLENCVCIIPSEGVMDIVHNLQEYEGKPMRVKWIFLDVYVNDIYRLDDIFDFPPVLEAKNSRRISEIIEEIQALGDTHFDICEKNILSYELLSILIGFASPKQDFDKSIIPAIDCIRTNYFKNIKIEDLARLCNFSLPVFYKKFKTVTHQTPASYINNYRLSIASKLLCTTLNSISEIAESTGFYDQFYFSKCFKAKYELSPIKYREKLPSL